MTAITITISGEDEFDTAAAAIIIAKAFIDIGALNIVSPRFSESTISTLEQHLDAEAISRCKRSCLITIN